jgi:DNA polymerase III delta subunit
MIGRYFTILMILNDERKVENNEYKLASKAGISPFFVKEYLGALRRYSPNELDNAVIAITKADHQLKTSSSSKLVILQNMLISIMDHNR